MRVVQLDIGGYRLEFHPYVTVLRGLHRSLRAELVAALEALAVGEAMAEGMVEAHGVFLDLSEGVMTLLDLGKPGRSDLELVVRADQLPGGLGPGRLVRNDLDRRRERVAGELARLEADAERAQLALATSREALEAADASGDLDGAPSEHSISSVERLAAELERQVQQRQALEASLAGAKAAHAGAHDALDAEQTRLARAREDRATTARVAGEAGQALEAARAQSDPFAAAAFDAARDRLQALQAPVAVEDEAVDREPAPDVDAEDSSVDINDLELRRSEVEASLLALDTVDPSPVESALEQVRSQRDVELVPSADANRVADEWVRNEAALAGEGSVEDTSGNVLAAARQRLDVARVDVFEAERAVRVPDIDRLDIEALENAHEAVLVAQGRAQKRFGGERARQKLTEARAMEQAILDRIGFDTYSSFLMGTSIQHVDTQREDRLEASRAELAAAEDALAVLEEGVDAELALAALLARRRDLRDEATGILGLDPGDDIEWTLRHHRVEVEGGGDRTRRLCAALEAAGMVLGDEPPPRDMLVELAEIWLEEQRETAQQRDSLTDELSDVQAALSRVSKFHRPEGSEGDAGAGAGREAELDRARAQMTQAEQRLERQSAVEAEVSERKSYLAQALEAEQTAVAELVAAEEAEAEAARIEHESDAERARLEAELAAALAAERQTLDALADVTRLVAVIGPEDRSARAAAVGEAEAAVARADAAAASARGELAEVDAMLEKGTSDNGDRPAVTTVAGVEDLEWFLLSRLAGQRSLSYAGSLPFVLDDALRGVRGRGLNHLLSRLERMSSAVQVVILSDDSEIAAWAEALGPDRAVTVHPVPL
jgi:hypothetical protein